MPSDVSRDELKMWLDNLQAGIDRVELGQTTLGREVSELRTCVAVLKDRSARDPAARWGILGNFLAAILAGLWGGSR